MHVLIAFLTLLVIALGSYLHSKFMIKLSPRGHLLPYLIPLAAPILIIGMMFIGFCLLMVTGGDGHLRDGHRIIHLMAWSAAAIMASALAFSLTQRIVASILVRRYPKAKDPALISLANRVATRLGMRCPTLRVYESTHPVILSGGIMGADRYILLSSWIASSLDEEEKEAVLAHELAHIRRRDDLTVWVAQIMRNVTFYLPALWVIWQKLKLHIEVASDELAIKVTGRPLALASALLKAGSQTLRPSISPHWVLGNHLFGAPFSSSSLIQRVGLLMGETQETDKRERSGPLRATVVSLASIVTLQAVALILFFIFLYCY